MISQMLKFCHSGNLGDVFYSLPAIKQACTEQDTQAVLFIKLNVPSIAINGNHPVGNVMMNDYMFKMAKPLLKSCPFIYDVLPWTNQKVDYDLDKFRDIGFNLSAHSISRWYFFAYPMLSTTLSEQIIPITNNNGSYIVLNRSERYNNANVDYSILNNLKEDIFFTGTINEFARMNKVIPNLKHKEVDNFLELAWFISQSKFFIGNQSMNFAIAEQIKKKRVLECSFACPNVIPEGGEYFEIFTTEGLEYAINKFNQ